MDSCFDQCLLCGALIRTGRAWLREYRAIYRDPTGPSITGVGCYDGSANHVAPSNPTLRWDNMNEQDVEVEIEVMAARPSAGRRGFILHEACWCLLQKSFEPEPVPVPRLLKMCESLPFPIQSSGVCWGHNYGELFTLDTRTYYPWYEIFHPPHTRTSCLSTAQENPFEIPKFPMTLSHPIGPPTAKSPMVGSAEDCFSKLPWEIRVEIAILLPTNDALNLRLACRSFLPLYSSITFWASRFHADGERGFLFEASRKRSLTELISFYRLTGPMSCPIGLQNRRRIWKLIRQLTKIARQPYANCNTCANEQQLASENWIRIAGDERTEELTLERFKESDFKLRPFFEGCYSMETIVLNVPENLVQLGITTIELGAMTYITGIRLLGENQVDIRGGYVSGRNEIIHNLERLHGFRLAVGIGGVRALQIIGQEGCSSRWFGRTENIPLSERLVHSEPVKTVKITLDGFKITGLAVSAQRSSQSRVSKPLTMSIRHTALWYPNIPSEELYLNEDSFTGPNPLNTGYRPFYWIHFGGQRGKYLHQIVEMSAHYVHALHRLEFIYEDDGSREGIPSSRLGTCRGEGVYGISKFAIDGAAGERIESIEVGIKQKNDPTAADFRADGFLSNIKITTNRGRVYEIGSIGDDVRMQSLQVTKGTTITGLYASHDVGYGHTSLGVISEMLP